MLQTLSKPAEPRIIETQEERPLEEWQELYPDLWLLLEVTEEDEGEILKCRLIAVDPEDTNLVPLWREAAQQGKITAMFHGVYTEPGPTVVVSSFHSNRFSPVANKSQITVPTNITPIAK